MMLFSTADGLFFWVCRWLFGVTLMYGTWGPFIRYFKRSRKYQLSIVTLGFLVSVYLFFISLYEIGTICYYCTVSLIIISSLFGASFFNAQKKQRSSCGYSRRFSSHNHNAFYCSRGQYLPKSSRSSIAGSSYPICQRGATFMVLVGVMLAGSERTFWFSYCLIFLTLSVPPGQNTPQSTICLLKKIKSYPTWLIDGKR